ncbi:MAG: DUF6427 family protein [Saprospiraceae bacterium]|nr:hypothetical protein [Lewinella sp.]
MLSLFRTNQLILGIFLLAYALLLRFWILFDLGAPTRGTDFPLLSGWVLEKMGDSDWWSALTALLFLWIQALLINSMVASNRMASEINLFPGLFYILVGSAIPAFQVLSPFLLANTFLIISFGQLIKVYRQNRCMDHLFNAGFFIGVASLFYAPYILFLLPVLIGLNILRAFNSREWMAVLLGGALPLLWLLIIGFLTDHMASYWQEWLATFGFLDTDFRAMNGMAVGSMIIIGLAVISVLAGYGANMQKTIIEVRKKIDIQYWLLFFALIVTIFSSHLSLSHLMILAPMTGILLSFQFTRMARATAEIVHLLLVIVVLLFHYLVYSGQL